MAAGASFVATKSVGQARYHPKHWELGPLSVPAELWSNGWVTVLSGKATLAYIVLCNHRSADEVFRVPKIKTHQYGLSNDMWLPAIAELKDRKLVRTYNVATQAGAIGHRVEYELIDKRLQSAAPKDLFRL